GCSRRRPFLETCNRSGFRSQADHSRHDDDDIGAACACFTSRACSKTEEIMTPDCNKKRMHAPWIFGLESHRHCEGNRAQAIQGQADDGSLDRHGGRSRLAMTAKRAPFTCAFALVLALQALPASGAED